MLEPSYIILQITPVQIEPILDIKESDWLLNQEVQRAINMTKQNVCSSSSSCLHFSLSPEVPLAGIHFSSTLLHPHDPLFNA